MKTLYIVDIDNNRCITHDGHIQIGIHPHNSAKHVTLCNELADKNGLERINWVNVYWKPDVFKDRYQRVSYQKTQKCNEGSPKTDNHLP